MDDFSLVQHVGSETHKRGGLPDHVLSSENMSIEVTTNSFLTKSDHSVICFSLNIFSTKRTQQLFRNWKKFNPEIYLKTFLFL